MRANIIKAASAMLLASCAAGLAIADENTERDRAYDTLQSIPGWVSSFDITNDGTRLAIEAGPTLKIYDARGNELADLGDGAAPQWSPNEDLLAFYSHRSGDRQLWIWAERDGQVRQLTHIERGIDPDPTTRISGWLLDALRFDWAPDGCCIAFASRVAEQVGAPDQTLAPSDVAPERADAIVLDETQRLHMPPLRGAELLFGRVSELRSDNSWGYRESGVAETLYNQIFLVRVDRGDVEQVTRGPRTRFHPSWSPNGRSIAFASVASPSLSAVETGGAIGVVDVHSGRDLELTSGSGIRYQPRWSRDSARIAFLSIETLFSRPHIEVVNAARPHRVYAGPPLARHVRSFDWRRGEEGFVVIYVDGVSTRVGASTLASRDISSLSPPGSSPSNAIQFAQFNQGSVAWLQSDPLTLSSVRAVGSADAILWRAPMPAGLPSFLGRVDSVTWRNSRGEEKEGTLLFPPDYDPSRAYPTIVDVYPLAGGGSGWDHPMNRNFGWASLGYVVFSPSPRAPNAWMNPWTTEESSMAGQGVRGWDLAYDDVTSGLDELIRQGIVDGNRLCVHGHSNGGGVATYLITRTNRFRCAVIVAPAQVDLIGPALSYPVDPSAYSGMGPFEQNLTDYVAASPILHLDTVSTPVLIAAGDEDAAVLDVIGIYNRLSGMGKPVTMVRYPQQGHVFSGDALRDFWNRELDFIDRHIGPTD